MEYQIHHQPEFALLNVKIPDRQTLFVEASAMASMDANVSMKTQWRGGLRRIISRESLFINRFTADGGGEINIAPGPAGDIGHYHLQNDSFFIASSCYVAHTEGVQYETKFQGLAAGFFSGAGLFLVKMNGVGHVWFNSFGAMVELDIHEESLIDNGHIVAFTSGLEFEIIRLGGYKSLFFSGEGLVCRFRGRGKVWMQTKKPAALVNWAHQFRPVKSRD